LSGCEESNISSSLFKPIDADNEKEIEFFGRKLEEELEAREHQPETASSVHKTPDKRKQKATLEIH